MDRSRRQSDHELAARTETAALDRHPPAVGSVNRRTKVSPSPRPPPVDPKVIFALKGFEQMRGR